MLIWTIRVNQLIPTKIDVRSVRKLYLITYSQADVGRFPTKDGHL